MIVIAFCGRLNSGKGTAARILEEQFGFTPMAFADPLKQITHQLFGTSKEELWGPSERRGKRTRTILQQLGTEFGRKFDPDVWVNQTHARLRKWEFSGIDTCDLLPPINVEEPRVVITDLRFPNEAKLIVEKWEGSVVKIDRPDIERTGVEHQHASETAIDLIDPKHLSLTITNRNIHSFKAAVKRQVLKVLNAGS